MVIVENGRVRLAQEDPRDVAVGGRAVGPDLVEGDEQVGVGGSTAVLLEVPELRAPTRDVVDHQVEHDVVVRRQGADVRPGAEPRIDLVVRDRREPAVARGREGRQHVDAAEQPVQRPVSSRPTDARSPPSESG